MVGLALAGQVQVALATHPCTHLYARSSPPPSTPSYRMDYAALINYHRARGADVTIATTAADEDHARHLGILQARRARGVGRGMMARGAAGSVPRHHRHPPRNTHTHAHSTPPPPGGRRHERGAL